MCRRFSWESLQSVINWVLHSGAGDDVICWTDSSRVRIRDESQWCEKCCVVNSQLPLCHWEPLVGVQLIFLFSGDDVICQSRSRCWILEMVSSEEESVEESVLSLPRDQWPGVLCREGGEQSSDKIHKYSLQPTLGNWDLEIWRCEEGWVESRLPNWTVTSPHLHNSDAEMCRLCNYLKWRGGRSSIELFIPLLILPPFAGKVAPSRSFLPQQTLNIQSVEGWPSELVQCVTSYSLLDEWDALYVTELKCHISAAVLIEISLWLGRARLGR